MKTMIIAATITFLTASPTNAATYRGTFESVWRALGYESKPVTATVEATSDGVNFQIDSMVVQFTDTLIAATSTATIGSTLDPIAVSVDMFSASQLLVFIPGSDIASIAPLSFGWGIQYDMIYRKDSTFQVISVDSQLGPGVRSTDTLLDFGVAGEISISFSALPTRWGLPTFDITPGIPAGVISTSLLIPTSPVVLSVIPEPTACGLVLAATLCLAIGRRRRR